MKEDYQKPEIQEMDSALFFPVVHGASDEQIGGDTNEGEGWG